jgi:beta-lactamase superfamily II metal-dependent hydrolase
MAIHPPERVTLRAYNVGFGDCFLLTFHYAEQDRHVLIDFGSTAKPKNAEPEFMTTIAEDIRKQCTENGRGRLVAVVATHRHRDHISGFATGEDGTGRIIRALEPDLVMQPWTEDPEAKPDAVSASGEPAAGRRGLAELRRQYLNSLQDMHAVSAAVCRVAQDKNAPLATKQREQLRFLGDDNLPNRSAVRNLMTMGKKAEYLHCGSKTRLNRLLPGVTVHVLGPPDLTQSESIRRQRKTDQDEFWHLKGFAQFQAYWKAQALAGGRARETTQLFAGAARRSGEDAPPHTRWFTNRLDTIRGSQLLELVRSLDRAMNNTSLILLFQIGDFAMLFPGDAQIENWSFALRQEKYQKLLAGVSVYKVGHHGSLNATPRTLWNLFQHKDRDEHAHGRLQSVMSTKSGKHGSVPSRTEVPRRSLVAALDRESTLVSTQSLRKSQLFQSLEFSMQKARKAGGSGR